jgi:hypothetical protein
VASATGTDLLERPLAEGAALGVTDGGAVELSFRPFEIRTVRLTRAGGAASADGR